MAQSSSASLAALWASDAIADSAKPYFDALVAILADFGALEEIDGGQRPVAQLALPSPRELLTTLIERCPEANLEIRLAALALTQGARALRQGEFVQPGAHMLRRIEVDALLSAPAIDALAREVESLAEAAARPLRVLALEPWAGALDRVCLPLIRRGLVELTLATADRAAIEAHRAQAGHDNIEYLLLADGEANAAAARHDLVLRVASRELPAEQLPALANVRAHVSERAALLAAIPAADLYLDALAGCLAGWLVPVKGTEASYFRVPSPDSVKTAFAALGATSLVSRPLDNGPGVIVSGRIPSLPTDAVSPSAVAIFGADHSGLATALHAQSLAGDDPATLRAWAEACGEKRAVVIIPAGAPSTVSVEPVAQRIDQTKAALEALDGLAAPARVIVVTEDAQTDGRAAGESDAGIYGFVRVAINEFPGVDLRVFDITTGADAERTCAQLRRAIDDAGNEREWLSGPDGLRVNRVRRGLEAERTLGEGERSLLRFDQPGRLESHEWVRTARHAPAEGEIEIAVAGIGLNFRDVLVGLGILDDDLLGAGLTAASLGFECSGTVTKVGAGVTGLKPGDRVMGFAKDVFSSHVVAPDWQFFIVPDQVSLEAAATVPVAFATAWFSLMDRARLRKGMDVLVHGGAGGVGLAAIQIAKRAGARVIATASSDERRAIALAAGADIVYDSRNERFAEAIERDLGGVDVVLNSLAGPAMVASFKLVKPFGTFIELGKRDYLDNSQLGLRPFIRNIAYIGVDLDELLSHDRGIIREMMATLADLMASGELRPLPFQTYDAHEIGAAFRSMQASEHVGKIVIRPAMQARRDYSALTFKAGEGVYLVIGGTSGLGFATAHWLARKGAGTLVLASRRGKIEDGLEDALEAMRSTGAKVLVESLDVSDAKAVRALVERVSREHGPVRGIVHAAVLLDDGMISGLTPERLRAVLKPKILGALNLEAATADQPLDFFVVYSSATTVIGSPGQGAYVGANAFLEGFARRRRAEGKPALAIGWGAIADVGIIARDKQLGQRLRRTTGVVGIKSSEGLAHLGRLLELGDAVGPIQFYTNIAPGAAAEKLALLNSPAFNGLALARREDTGEEDGDLVSAVAGKPRAEALTIITQALRREVSHILRMPVEQIDVERPLGELGLDSLMALELALSIERLSGREVPMIGAGDRRLSDIAGNILTQIGEGEETAESQPDAAFAQIVTMVQKHTTEELSSADVEALRGKFTAKAG